MPINFCPDCGSRLQPGSSFCHECGRDLKRVTVSGPAQPLNFPMAPAMPPLAMFPPLGMEPPPVPVGRHRALGAMAGIVMLFTCCVVMVMALVVYFNKASVWEEYYDGFDYWDEQVYHLEYVAAAVFMFASFAIGIPAGIMALRASRYPVALAGCVLLAAGSFMVLLLDEVWVFAFTPIMGVTSLALLVLARPGFSNPPGKGKGPPPSKVDGYGWEVVRG